MLSSIFPVSSRQSLLVLGASGLLGRYVALEAGERVGGELHLAAWRGTVPDVSKARLHRFDLRDRDKVRKFLEKVRPMEVINCAGIVKSLCVNERDATIMNSTLPHLIAQTITPWNGRLIHVSTDCVFSGHRGSYAEKDPPDPVGLYGRTKLAGEVTEAPHLTIRTSFIGLEPPPAKGLLGWFLEQKGRVKGFRRSVWSGLTADTLAQMLVGLATRREVTGLLHLAGEAIDKAALLRMAARVFNKNDVVIEPVDEPVYDRSLDASRMRLLKIQPPSIQRMLEEMSGKAGSSAVQAT